MKSSIQIMSLVALALLAGACGNQVQTPDARFLPNPSGYGYSYSGGYGYSNSNFPGYSRCSETINIQNASGDRSREYRACTASAGFDSMMIYPAVSQTQESVCVFPSQNGNLFSQQSQLVKKCVNLPAGGTTLSFQGVRFDSIYVVPSHQANQFAWCISTGNFYNCANQYGVNYSFGRIQ